MAPSHSTPLMGGVRHDPGKVTQDPSWVHLRTKVLSGDDPGHQTDTKWSEVRGQGIPPYQSLGHNLVWFLSSPGLVVAEGRARNNRNSIGNILTIELCQTGLL